MAVSTWFRCKHKQLAFQRESNEYWWQQPKEKQQQTLVHEQAGRRGVYKA
jgi:hypothetical protein